MKLHKKIILSGTLMGAIAFAPLAFAADTTNIQTGTPAGITVQMPVKAKLNKKSITPKVVDYVKVKANFMKQVAILTTRQTTLGTTLDKQATAGKDVTLAKSNLVLAQAKLADASAAGNSIVDKVTLSAANKLLESAKTLTTKVMGAPKAKIVKKAINIKKAITTQTTPATGTTTTPKQ